MTSKQNEIRMFHKPKCYLWLLPRQKELCVSLPTHAYCFFNSLSRFWPLTYSLVILCSWFISQMLFPEAPINTGLPLTAISLSLVFASYSPVFKPLPVRHSFEESMLLFCFLFRVVHISSRGCLLLPTCVIFPELSLWDYEATKCQGLIMVLQKAL